MVRFQLLIVAFSYFASICIYCTGISEIDEMNYNLLITYHITLITILVNLFISYRIQLIDIVLHWLAKTIYPVSVGVILLLNKKTIYIDT